MPLNHLPASPSAPSRNLLPHKVLLALTLALAACDKPQIVLLSQSSPAKAPTGAITHRLVGSPLVLRQHLVQNIIKETLGATGGDFYTRGFARDAAHPSESHVHQLDVGFGPQRGTHVVTVKQADGKTHVKDMLDTNNDGTVDFAESSISWSVRRHDMGDPMTHTEKDYRIDQSTQDDFASALQQALVVLEGEKEAKQKDQK